MRYVAISETRKLINQTTFYQQHISPTFGKFYQLRYRFVKDYRGLFSKEYVLSSSIKIVKILTKSITWL